MRGAAGTARIRPAAWGAAATATVLSASAAAVFVTAVPHHRAPGPAGQPGSPAAGQNSAQGQRAAGHTRSDPAQPAAAPGGSPGAGQAVPSAPVLLPTPSALGGAASTAPSPAPGPTLPVPLPTPTPTCIINVLGIKVCTPPL